jgi:hypothetical protein
MCSPALSHTLYDSWFLPEPADFQEKNAQFASQCTAMHGFSIAL